MTAPTDPIDFQNNTSMTVLFDALDEGVIVWSRDKKLVYANNAARKITQLKLAIGSDLLPASSTMSVRIVTSENSNRDMNEMPVYRAFAGHDVPREDMRYIDPEGRHRWLSVSARRVCNDKNELMYVISSLRDISLRKSREHKLRFMVESAKILSLNLDFDQRLIEKAKLTVPHLADWCSINVIEGASTRRITVIHGDPEKIALLKEMDEKYPRQLMLDIIQKQSPVFIPKVTNAELKEMAVSPAHFDDLKALQMTSLMVIPIISRGEGVGAMTLAYAESGRVYDESDLEFFKEFCYHLAVIFDNARMFEEIETRDKSKDIFLAALSHELRNPLAPIKSSLELIKMREIPQEMREEIDIIEHQFDHMGKLLNDLLDVTRFTQDRISLSSHPVDLRRLIERALRGTDALVRQADITLHFAYPSAPMSVVADETRLEQAVSNLISNAIKFTPAGGSIWVDLERGATHAMVRVRDNGAGIDQEDLPNIFDMYYQGRNKSTVNSGLGIGLLLVQRIIALHGGTVTAKSEGQGKGSEFEIQLPLVEAAAQERQGTLPLSIARSMRILVVDDNAPAADSLVRLLNKLGANATAVYSGYEALGIHRLNEIDLFILDVGMPHMNGYELVAALRSRDISAPIVALTGYGLSDDKKRAREAGFTSHLTKPVGIAELNALFEDVLTTTA